MARYIKENFFWWMSEDDVLGWPSRYLYSDWIDVKWSSQFIQLHNRPTEDIDTWSEIWKSLMEIKDTLTNSVRVLCFTGSWVFRSSTVWAVDWWVRETANFIIWDTVYLVKDNWPSSAYTLYEESVDTAYSSISWTTTLVPTTWLLTAWNLSTATYDYNIKWATIIWDVAYIWLGSKICRFSPTSANEVVEYDIFWEDVIWVTYSWWYVRVYTASWRLMIWDWNTQTIAETINLNIPLEATYQIWNIDYIYTWDTWQQKGLYYMNWYTLTPLFKKTYSAQENIHKFNFIYDSMTCPFANRGGNLFWLDWDTNVYEYGYHIEWLPKAYSLLGKTSSYWLDYQLIRCVLVVWDYVYYNYTDWVNRWTDKVRVSNWSELKVAQWTLVTNVNPLWNWLYKKTAKYLYFKVWDVDADRTITVSISIDWWDYTELTTVIEQPLDNIVRIPIQWDMRDYSLKFVFATTLSTTTSPKIYYWPAFDYDEHDI